MGRRKANQPYLPDWLTESPQPVVLLNEGGTILALNPAAAGWLKVDGKEAVGRIAHAGNSHAAEPIDRRLAGLAIGGNEAAAVYSLDDADRPVAAAARQAWFEAGDGKGKWRLLIVDDGPLAGIRGGESAVVAARLELARQRAHAARAAQVLSLLGIGPAAERLRAQVHAAGTADAHLLIEGPEGGEQELLARRIHALRYARAARIPPLTPIQCKAADQAFVQEVVRHGLAERVHCDPPVLCLLLVDAGLLDPGSQAELAGFLRASPNLLRVFATRTSSLGGMEGRESAAHEPDPFLEAHLSAQAIRLPALAERRVDLAGIFSAAVDAVSRQKGQPSPTLSTALVEAVTEYGWPGEFIELWAAVAAMMARSLSENRQEKGSDPADSRPPGRTLDVDDLPETVRQGLKAQRGSRLPAEQIDLDQLLATVEREVIERALALCRNNRSDAARRLGLTRARMLRRCSQLGIALPGETVEFEPVEFDEVKE